MMLQTKEANNQIRCCLKLAQLQKRWSKFYHRNDNRIGSRSL